MGKKADKADKAERTDKKKNRMGVDPTLLSLLVCPQSGGILEHVGDELISRKAGLAYPIRDGVPVMIIEEARILGEDEWMGAIKDMARGSAKGSAPKELLLRDGGRLLSVIFSSGRYDFTAEYLRVMTPSAEARGHGGDTGIIVAQKRHVRIISLERVGRYAIRPIFDDGHESGLYSWDLLHYLGEYHARLWQDYLNALEDGNLSRG